MIGARIKCDYKTKKYVEKIAISSDGLIDYSTKTLEKLKYVIDAYIYIRSELCVSDHTITKLCMFNDVNILQKCVELNGIHVGGKCSSDKKTICSIDWKTMWLKPVHECKIEIVRFLFPFFKKEKGKGTYLRINSNDICDLALRKAPLRKYGNNHLINNIIKCLHSHNTKSEIIKCCCIERYEFIRYLMELEFC